MNICPRYYRFSGAPANTMVFQVKWIGRSKLFKFCFIQFVYFLSFIRFCNNLDFLHKLFISRKREGY